MTTFNNGLRALACGVAAVAITAVMSWSFVQSTSSPPGTAVASSFSMAKLTIQQRHVWFGQSLPAVLVD